MLMKWIRCAVDEEWRIRFSRAQAAWGRISSAAGLIGQYGGWDVRAQSGIACILSIWQDDSAYAKFMRGFHDFVTEGSGQASTYRQIKVDMFDIVLSMPGKAPGLVEGIESGARFLRVAECEVLPDRVDHFVATQSTVWRPAMKASPGMCGGAFLRSRDANTRFAVITSWASAQEHDEYSLTHVPQLRSQAELSDDLVRIEDRFIPLEPSWSVIPSA